jgi:hypothetical protein
MYILNVYIRLSPLQIMSEGKEMEQKGLLC